MGRWLFERRFMHRTQRILDVLDCEWTQLSSGPATRRRLRAWQAQQPSLSGPRTLVELRNLIEDRDLEESSELVWALLQLASHDELVGRFLLQIIVPGLAGEARWLMSWARRVDPNLIGSGDVDQMLVLCAMEAIRHAHGTRRSHPICSILRRTHRLLVRETRSIEAWKFKTVPDETESGSLSVDDPTPRPGKMLLDLLTEAADGGHVARRDVDLIWLIDVEGYTSTELAPSMGITPRAVAQRRWRAEGRLSRMVENAA